MRPIVRRSGLLSPGMRRALITQHGDVWIARAVRPGTASDRRLLLEHRVGAVPIEDCECPQPSFVDCSKPPTRREDGVISDPVVFENRASEPVDVFFWNGERPHPSPHRAARQTRRPPPPPSAHTPLPADPPSPALPPRASRPGTCEELVSWDEIGGVQPYRLKPLLSTQGHSFRLRSAASRRLLMAHTLNDLVVRACDDDDAALRGSSIDGLDALRAQTTFFETEAARLRELLSGEISRLEMAIALHGSNDTAAAIPHATTVRASVPPLGATTWSLVGLAK